MVLKVRFLQDKDVPATSLTDWAKLGENRPTQRLFLPAWAKLGGNQKPQRLVLPDMPSVMVHPQGGRPGQISYHGLKLDLSSDNTFEYGAWPQKKVLPVWQDILNQALASGQLRSNSCHYYTLNGQACHEYLFKGKLYVFVKNKSVWMEVLPVRWQLDEKQQRAYTTQVVIADSQQSSKFLGLVGQQIIQSNKYLREMAPHRPSVQTQQKRILKSTLLHTLRTLRDMEKQEGHISPEIQQAYALFTKKAQHKRS